MDIKLDHPSPVEEKPPAVEEPHSVEDGMSNIAICFILVFVVQSRRSRLSGDVLRFCGDHPWIMFFKCLFLTMHGMLMNLLTVPAFLTPFSGRPCDS